MAPDSQREPGAGFVTIAQRPSPCRWRAGWLLGLAMSGLPALSSPARAVAPECREAPAREDRFVGLGPRGELILASGARAVLDGVHWPDGPESAEAARAWLIARQGRALTVVPRGDTDRWGRSRVDAIPVEAIPIHARAGEAEAGRQPEAMDLAAGLVAGGLAEVDAGERDSLCRPALLAVEAGARSQRLGLWSQGRPEVRDGPALRERIGRFVVAEGTVLWVGERARRTYLDFARKGENGLTVTVSKRTWRQLQERGLQRPVFRDTDGQDVVGQDAGGRGAGGRGADGKTPAPRATAWRGRHLRVRGILEAWRGPTLDIASADMIEVLDGEQAQRR